MFYFLYVHNVSIYLFIFINLESAIFGYICSLFEYEYFVTGIMMFFVSKENRSGIDLCP